MRRATNVRPETRQHDAISIHALLAESDDNTHTYRVYCPAFLSTLSLRRATQNILCVVGIQVGISIHALLAESDNGGTHHEKSRTISIHALLAESDPPRMIREPATSRFLSTLSLRRATLQSLLLKVGIFYFYPRSPCGERLNCLFGRYGACYFYPRSPCGERRSAHPGTRQPCAISIHALLAESDVVHTLELANLVLFLSTLSLRRAT